MSALDELLSSLAGAPAFPGARCRGKHHLFDPAAADERPDIVDARQAQALGLCSHCPGLARFASWLDGLPPKKRPLGVVAGRVNNPPPERKSTA